MGSRAKLGRVFYEIPRYISLYHKGKNVKMSTDLTKKVERLPTSGFYNHWKLGITLIF